MKANEAPEKIYVVDATFPDYVYFDGSPINTKKIDDHDIEYTRTDAFIDKIENYLNSKLYDWVSITNLDQRSYANVIPKKDFIEDFINYMKGE